MGNNRAAMQHLIYFMRGTGEPSKANWGEDAPFFPHGEKEKGVEYEIFSAVFGSAVVVHPNKDTDGALKRFLHERTESFEESNNWPQDISNRFWMDIWDLQEWEMMSRFHRTLPLVLPVECGLALAEIWRNIRLSFVSGAYFSVCCCSRSAIEYAVTEVGLRLGLWPDPTSSPKQFSIDWPIRKRFRFLTVRNEDLSLQLDEIFTTLNSVMHSGTVISKDVSLDVLEKSRMAINSIYARYSKKLSPLKGEKIELDEEN